MFCPHCGSEAAPHAVVCIKCGGSLAVAAPPSQQAPVHATGNVPKPRVAYVLLGLFLGTLGVHNFLAGYVGRGIAQLLITLLIGWLVLPLVAVWIWNVIEICVVDHDANGVPFN